MIGPIVSIGIIAVVFLIYLLMNQYNFIREDINNEIKNDVAWHDLRIKKIYKLSEINDAYYRCSNYNCSNITEFLSNLNECIREKGYDYEVRYDGQFYIYVDGFKDILNRRYLCG